MIETYIDKDMTVEATAKEIGVTKSSLYRFIQANGLSKQKDKEDFHSFRKRVHERYN